MVFLRVAFPRKRQFAAGKRVCSVDGSLAWNELLLAGSLMLMTLEMLPSRQQAVKADTCNTIRRGQQSGRRLHFKI